ncbi:MAG: enoyl-CoA hydratase/isomerase family protein [Legionella sp.]|nr:enoyl-CoA hydratase/isomerase family protein [Legionella sp.]
MHSLSEKSVSYQNEVSKNHGFFSENNLVFTEVKNSVAIIKLNNPRSLNAFTPIMLQTLICTLEQWYLNPHIQIIIIDKMPNPLGAKPFFGVGGDVKFFYNLATVGDNACVARAHAFFKLVNQLMLLVHNSPKTIIAINDGLVLGGALGLSIHATYRIATENTIAGMPEINIGFFPDVGSSYFLTHLRNGTPAIGMYLSLLGKQISTGDCMRLGLHTHCIPSSQLKTLYDELIQQPGNVENILKKLSLNEYKNDTPLKLDKINLHFGKDLSSLEAIFSSLSASSQDPWCSQTLAKLRQLSPSSLLLTWHLLKDGEISQNFVEIISRDAKVLNLYFNSGGGLLTPDFVSGMDKLLKKKTTIQWQQCPHKELLDFVTSEELKLPSESPSIKARL